MDFSQLVKPSSKEAITLLPNHQHDLFRRHTTSDLATIPSGGTSPVQQLQESEPKSPQSESSPLGFGPTAFRNRPPIRYGTFPAEFIVLRGKRTNIAVTDRQYTQDYKLSLRDISAVKVVVPIRFPADFLSG
jgi:hypothetical protein